MADAPEKVEKKPSYNLEITIIAVAVIGLIFLIVFLRIKKNSNIQKIEKSEKMYQQKAREYRKFVEEEGEIELDYMFDEDILG